MQKAENRGQSTALTSGSIKKQLVLFSIPIFLGTLLQQLYNVIDAVVAGRLVNEDALSAIGVSVSIYLLFVSVILGLAIGITILLFGIGDGIYRSNFCKTTVTDYTDPRRTLRACYGIFKNGIFRHSVFNAV